MLLVVWGITKSAHPWFLWTAVWTRSSDGVAHTPIRQPARVTDVQPQEPPSGVQLPHLGNLAVGIQTSLHCLCEVHLRDWIQEVDSA